jgi:hypothetical protein
MLVLIAKQTNNWSGAHFFRYNLVKQVLYAKELATSAGSAEGVERFGPTITPKAFVNFSPGLERATTLGIHLAPVSSMLKALHRSNAFSVTCPLFL